MNAIGTAPEISEMGILLPDGKTVRLSRATFSLIPSLTFLTLGTVTEVPCPFCKKGFLKIVNIGPHALPGVGWGGASHPHMTTKYEFSCSNDECTGRFIYS